jgi:hypothetical protein
MTLEEAMKENPYDSKEGNESAYCRYLRYNVDGFYSKSIEEVKEIFHEQSNTFNSELKPKML